LKEPLKAEVFGGSFQHSGGFLYSSAALIKALNDKSKQYIKIVIIVKVISKFKIEINIKIVHVLIF